MTPKKWIEQVVEFGPMVHDGAPRYAPQVHHVVGRKGRQRIVRSGPSYLIGPWFLLYLPWRFHDVHSGDPLNVTHWHKRFTESFGMQCDLFAARVELIQNAGLEIPDNSILEAIAETRK